MDTFLDRDPDTPISSYDEAADVTDRWEISDSDDFPLLDQIAWCLRKASEHDRLIDEKRDLAKRERDRVLAPIKPLLDDIDAWERDAVSGDENRRQWFKERLERWAVADRETHLDKPKKVTTPSGSVSTVVRNETVELIDAEEFVNWYVTTFDVPTDVYSDDVLSFSPKVNLTGLRRRHDFVIVEADGPDPKAVVFASTGELIPGLGVRQATITPKVEWVS